MSYFDQPRGRAFQKPNQSSQNSKFSRPDRPATRYSANATTEAVVLGRVKWFDTKKGFGFVGLDDGTDVFLHGSVLSRSGINANPGDTVRVGVGTGPKGRQVTEVLEARAAGLDHTTSPATGRPRREFKPEINSTTTDNVRGVVKWWSEQKGFGFVTPEAGTRDIFVHASTAARSGLSVEQGMAVWVKVREGAKGPEAIEIASA